MVVVVVVLLFIEICLAVIATDDDDDDDDENGDDAICDCLFEVFNAIYSPESLCHPEPKTTKRVLYSH